MKKLRIKSLQKTEKIEFFTVDDIDIYDKLSISIEGKTVSINGFDDLEIARQYVDELSKHIKQMISLPEKITIINEELDRNINLLFGKTGRIEINPFEIAFGENDSCLCIVGFDFTQCFDKEALQISVASIVEYYSDEN